MAKRPLSSLTREEFDKLKASGMLWEIYMDAPERYEEIPICYKL